jgi:hypothetical protein
MNKDINHLLTINELHPIMEKMSEDAFDILFNLEILFDNKIDVDVNFHDPKKFIICINNFIRNIVFFVEKASKLKTKYLWLYDCLKEYREKNEVSFSLLVKLRNDSVHQELIVPQGALSFGLYRIKSSDEYIYKLGLGNITDIENLSPKYIFTPTNDIFHELLILHYLLFIDLEHSALNECLGISRSWKTKIKIKNSDREKSEQKVVDLYKLAVDFFYEMFNSVIEAYAVNRGEVIKTFNFKKESEYNCINTLLEIDLYPDLFSKLWESEIYPINIKERFEYFASLTCINRNKYIIKIFDKIPKRKVQLEESIKKFMNFSLVNCEKQEDYDDFLGFIMLPHWYIKCIGIDEIMNSIGISKITELFRLSKAYISKYNSNFESTSIEVKEIAIKEITNILKSIYSALTK